MEAHKREAVLRLERSIRNRETVVCEQEVAVGMREMATRDREELLGRRESELARREAELGRRLWEREVAIMRREEDKEVWGVVADGRCVCVLTVVYQCMFVCCCVQTCVCTKACVLAALCTAKRLRGGGDGEESGKRRLEVR